MAKKAWQSPELDVLDVNMTMLGSGDQYIDWTFIGGNLDIGMTDKPGTGEFYVNVPANPPVWVS